MKKLLADDKIIGHKIGDWKASLTPDGTILWTKAKKLFRKGSPVGVFATPHWNKENEVAIDVVNLNTPYDDVTLRDTITLKGNDNDLKTYLDYMKNLFSMLA